MVTRRNLTVPPTIKVPAGPRPAGDGVPVQEIAALWKLSVHRITSGLEIAA
jgi:hypothetical protein